MERRNPNKHDNLDQNSKKEKRIEIAEGGLQPTMEDHSLMMMITMMMMMMMKKSLKFIMRVIANLKASNEAPKSQEECLHDDISLLVHAHEIMLSPANNSFIILLISDRFFACFISQINEHCVSNKTDTGGFGCWNKKENDMSVYLIIMSS